MSTEALLWLVRFEATRQTHDPVRLRSYLDELNRRQRALCTYYLTTEQETRP
jgi:hypothetical protein